MYTLIMSIKALWIREGTYIVTIPLNFLPLSAFRLDIRVFISSSGENKTLIAVSSVFQSPQVNADGLFKGVLYS